MMATMALPEGVYEKDGQLYRDVPRSAGITTDESGRLLQQYDWVPRAVILPLATDPASVEQGRMRAVNQNVHEPTDFLHPRHGWLRGGRKPEREAPENLGNGSVSYRRTAVVIDPPDDEPQPAPAETKGKANGTR